jgi:type IV secretory pathway VirB2 component (pilin)
MSKSTSEKFFTTENTIVLTILITTILIMMITPENAQATVESSIKGVGSSLQKIAIGIAIPAFAIGGVGMMYGAQWGYRLGVGTVLGLCLVLGGPAITNFFSAQIR